jgi:hypothetical protein
MIWLECLAADGVADRHSEQRAEKPIFRYP